MTVSKGLFRHMHQTSAALGIFDGMHRGHMAVISKICGSTPSIVMTFEGLTKPGKKIMTAEMRIKLLRALGVTELLSVPFESVRAMEPEEFVETVLYKILNVKLVSCGFNFKFGKNASGDAQTLKTLCGEYGIQTIICEKETESGEAVSSTRIRQCVTEGDMHCAMRLLGRPFGYDYEVVGGQQRGRLMGTPTLNQHFEPDFCIPRFGVYSSVVQIGDKRLPAVTNVGVRPTVGSAFPLSETWIPDFSADLYGQRVETFLLEFMREEKKFSSLDELRAVILEDACRSKCIAKEFC